MNQHHIDTTIIKGLVSNYLVYYIILLSASSIQTPYLFVHIFRSFSGTMKSLGGMKWEVKLSSAGLVYLHFGKDILSHCMEADKDDSTVDLVYAKVYEKFVQEIDAIDNGVDQFEGEPRYCGNAKQSLKF